MAFVTYRKQGDMIPHITVSLSTHFCFLFISLKTAAKSFLEGVVEEVAAGAVVEVVVVVVRSKYDVSHRSR